ncbi:VTC domain-containing protein [Litorivicinus sp.]|nr:VTC domain-containing protein [Litorivicinus sp.]
MNLDTSLRREIKFVASEMFVIQIRGWLETSKLRLRKHFPDRIVNNIYYDTYNCDAYADNLDGISKRTKLRYRWYGPLDTPSDGRIELKKRFNSNGTKEFYSVNLGGNVATHKQLFRSIRGSAPLEWDVLLDIYSVPIIYNRYHRSYYISQCKKVRVTLDSNHDVMDQRMSGFINTRKKANVAQYIVVEVKFTPELTDYVSSMIADIPMRISRNSKYVNAVNSIL